MVVRWLGVVHKFLGVGEKLGWAVGLCAEGRAHYGGRSMNRGCVGTHACHMLLHVLLCAAEDMNC